MDRLMLWVFSVLVTDANAFVDGTAAKQLVAGKEANFDFLTP